MFSIFKKKKKKLTISDIVKQSLKQDELTLHIDIYVEDQILFQVVPARFYVDKGLSEKELKGFLEIHFFNNNKTFTNRSSEIAHRLYKDGCLYYYEEPKGNHNYIKPLGRNPESIEISVKNSIKNMYSYIEPSRINIKY